jgi:hypothetical protein
LTVTSVPALGQPHNRFRICLRCGRDLMTPTTQV